MTLEELYRRYVEFEAQGRKVDKVAFDAVKEEIGERIADIVVEERFGGASLDVLARTNQVPIFDRVYELGDGRYVLQGAEEMMIIDAKFGVHPLSYSNLKGSHLYEPGKGFIRFSQPHRVQQLEAKWVRYRVKEHRAAEKAAGQSGPGALSERLERAANEGRLKIYEIRTTDLEIRDGVVTGANVELVDHTERFNREWKTGRRMADETASLSRQAGLAANKLKEVSRPMQGLRRAAESSSGSVATARRKAEKALTKNIEAQRELEAFRQKFPQGPTRKIDIKKEASLRKKVEDTKTAWNEADDKLRAAAKREKSAASALSKQQRIVDEQTRIAEKARRAADAAHAARQEAGKGDIIERIKVRKTTEAAERARLAEPQEPATPRQVSPSEGGRAAEGPKATEMPGSDEDAFRERTKAAEPGHVVEHEPSSPAVAEEAGRGGQASAAAEAERGALRPPETVISDAERGLAGSESAAASGQERLGSKATSAAADAAKGAEAAGKELEVIAKASRMRSVGRWAIKGGKFVKQAGRGLLVVFEAVSPILDAIMILELGVSAIDYLASWMDRQRIRDREEWRRLAAFLSRPTEAVYMPPYKTMYIAGYGTAAKNMTGALLNGERGNANDFAFWLRKWIKDKSWQGFVYTTISVSLERQHVLGGDAFGYEYTYWFKSDRALTLSDTPPPNWKSESLVASAVGNSEKTNRRSGANQETVMDSDQNLAVEIHDMEVRYTYCAPALTPFDYVIAQCEDLISEIISFLSRYDPAVFPGMDSRVEYAFGDFYLFEKYQGPAPLVSAQAAAAISSLEWVKNVLRDHAQQPGDGAQAIGPGLTVGYQRRLRALELLLVGRKPKLIEVRDYLLRIITDESPAHLRKPLVPEISYINREYLVRYADDIHADLMRIFSACKAESSRKRYCYNGPVPPPKH